MSERTLNYGTHWTEAERSELCQLYTNGASDREIGDWMGRPESGVKNARLNARLLRPCDGPPLVDNACHRSLPCWHSSRDALASTEKLKRGWAKRDAVDADRFEFAAGEHGLTVRVKSRAA